MTERPSQTKQILDKLDNLTDDVSGIKQDIAGIKKQIEMQPKLDSALHQTLEEKLSNHNARIGSLESNQKWVVLAILGIVINTIMQLILK